MISLNKCKHWRIRWWVTSREVWDRLMSRGWRWISLLWRIGGLWTGWGRPKIMFRTYSISANSISTKSKGWSRVCSHQWHNPADHRTDNQTITSSEPQSTHSNSNRPHNSIYPESTNSNNCSIQWTVSSSTKTNNSNLGRLESIPYLSSYQDCHKMLSGNKRL